MIIYVHRAKCDTHKDNSISGAKTILKSNHGFGIELDVTLDNNKLFLGHDEKQEEVSLEFLKNKKIR